ncbi:MAG: Crp/Fnr family transcriptional regulator [Acidobacteriota bacterium]
MAPWLTPELLARLRSGPWFGSISRELESDLLGLATSRRLAPGEHLFFRGDPADGLYAVLEGCLRISGVTEAGKEAILSLVDAPNWLGEIALFDGLPRTHNAVAEGATRLLHVPAAGLNRLLSGKPHHWRDLGVLMALRLRLVLIGMEDLALLPAEGRLARRLVWLVETSSMGQGPGPCVVPISQAQLGMMLSLSRQTTNQILQSLQDQQVLRVAYGRIEILDRSRLMEVARVSLGERQVLSQMQVSPVDSPGG